MNELLERLNSIDGAYFDFVSAIEHYAKKKPDRLERVLGFLRSHPEASLSDVIEFVSEQADFYEDAAQVKVS